MAKFNVEKAKAAGFSDEQIQAFLSQRPELTPQGPSSLEGGERKPTFEEGMAFIQQTPLLQGLAAVQKGANKVGEFATEQLGQRGANPNVAAGLGTAISLAPDIALSASGFGAAKATKAGRLLMGPGLKKAGQAMGKALAKEGVAIEGELMGTPRTTKGIQEFSEGFRPILKASKEKVAAMIDPSELNRIRQQTGDVLDFLKVAKSGQQPKLLVPKATIANLSKLKEAVTSALKVAKPKLAGPIEDVAAAAKRSELLSALGKGLKKAAPVLGFGAAAGAGSSLFR